MKHENIIKSEKGQIADILMFFIFIVFVLYFIILFTSMQFYFRAQKMVDSVVRDEIEIIRTKGILTTSGYEDFLGRLGKYGNFNVLVIAEKQDEAGTRGKYFDLTTILNQPFKVGDFIKIFVESKSTPLFAEVLRMNLLFTKNNNGGGSDFRMQSMSSGMVCSDGFIHGVEVINMINKYYPTPPTPPNAPINGIWLKTLNYAGVPTGQSPTEESPSGFIQVTGTYNPESVIPRTTDSWIDYEGNYRMDVEINPNDYSIQKIYFSELIK